MPIAFSSDDPEAPALAVVGILTDRGGARHVGLLVEDTVVGCGEDVTYYHCAPPLEIGQMGSSGEPMQGCGPVDVTAWLTDVADSVIAEIQTWICLVRDRVVSREWTNDRAKVYIVTPRKEPILDAVSGLTLGIRYSCAGFVDECYRQGGIGLVSEHDSDMPQCSAAEIEEVFGRDLTRIGRRYGLNGAGPWNVLLPGYLINAMGRCRVDLPFEPCSDDRFVRSQAW